MAGSTATLLPIPYKLYTEEQVLEEDASVVNPMISSVLRCVRGGGRKSLKGGKLGELASVRPRPPPLTYPL